MRLQEIIAGSKERENEIKKLKKENLIIKIAPRLYTTNKSDPPEKIIKRNWYHVLSELYPQAILSHRSALERMLTPGGHIYLTHSYSDNIILPGLFIHFTEGHSAIAPDDDIFFGKTKVSGTARAYLENLQATRRKGEESKTLSREQMEVRMENLIRSKGEGALNEIRDKAKQIAPQLKMEREMSLLNSLVTDMIGTGSVKNLVTGVAKARVLGEPFDLNRIELFESLYGELVGRDFPDYEDKNTTEPAYKNFAFFESYFSNFIEGTEFTIDEAKQIIATSAPLPARDEDSHDVLGTYKIVADKKEMSIQPKNANDFLQILRERHGILLNARKTKKPGEFKDRNNRAGNTEFVDWELVTGTLKKGFEWYTLLKHPFAKAAYIMFLISEVHPFLDGNGRIARVMMNAELTAKRLSKIIIPTVYREDYMLSLKKLTKDGNGDPYIRMLLKAWQFSSTVHNDNADIMQAYLVSCNAFSLPGDGYYLKYGAAFFGDKQ